MQLPLVVLLFGFATAHLESCVLEKQQDHVYGSGHVEEPVVSSLDACCSACMANTACQAYTWASDSSTCFLKDNVDDGGSKAHRISGRRHPSPSPPVHVSLSLGARRSTTGNNFVCWNIDSSRNRGFFWRNLSVSAPYGAQLARQAAAISSAQGFSLLRFGGSGNDYLTYAFGGTECPPRTSTKECLNATQWRDLLLFAEAAKAKIIFGLSMNTGEDNEGGARATDGPYPFPWDPSNARAILQWTIDNHLDHLLAGFELGNEQNDEYTAEQTAEDFAILHNLTVELWPSATSRPVLFGPDPHSLHDTSGTQYKWIGDWLDGCRTRHVPIHAVTHHEYIEVDPTAAGFTSASKLDLNGAISSKMNATVRAHSSTVKIFGGEIGPHNGGSPPCDHTSMRWATFGSSLWYADALGSKAMHGYSGFCRQDYIGGDYGLVDCSTGSPLPDYYTALSFATTMGAGVLDVTGGNAGVRAYAHCTAIGESPREQAGSVTVLVINLNNRTATATFQSTVARQYVLSPSYDPAHSLIPGTGLMGTGALLNGKVLAIGKDGSVPAITGQTVASTEVHVPALSLAFFVLPGANGQCD